MDSRFTLKVRHCALNVFREETLPCPIGTSPLVKSLAICISNDSNEPPCFWVPSTKIFKVLEKGVCFMCLQVILLIFCTLSIIIGIYSLHFFNRKEVTNTFPFQIEPIYLPMHKFREYSVHICSKYCLVSFSVTGKDLGVTCTSQLTCLALYNILTAKNSHYFHGK